MEMSWMIHYQKHPEWYYVTPQKPIIHMIPGSGEKKNVFLLEAKFLIFVLCFLISMKSNLSIYFLVIVFHPLPKNVLRSKYFELENNTVESLFQVRNES